MRLRTTIQLPEIESKISYNDQIITIGSCFSRVMGDRLVRSKFNCLTNPFGTIYHPLSIFKLLKHSSDNSPLPNEGFLLQNEVHYHFDIHSDLSALSREELERKIIERIDAVHNALKKPSWVIITLGSTVAYHLKPSGKIVSNCHKVPQSQFVRTDHGIDEIVDSFENLVQDLHRLNNQVRILLTVSPVRHVKDGLVQNALSKSKLRAACQEMTTSSSNVFYFPSYEIMMDDLRDYRFYESDLIHPNDLAHDYIWDLFTTSMLSEDDIRIVEDLDKVLNSLTHRPRHPETSAHKKFLTNTLTKLEVLNEKIDLTDEIAVVQERLNG